MGEESITSATVIFSSMEARSTSLKSREVIHPTMRSFFTTGRWRILCFCINFKAWPTCLSGEMVTGLALMILLTSIFPLLEKNCPTLKQNSGNFKEIPARGEAPAAP